MSYSQTLYKDLLYISKNPFMFFRIEAGPLKNFNLDWDKRERDWNIICDKNMSFRSIRTPKNIGVDFIKKDVLRLIKRDRYFSVLDEKDLFLVKTGGDISERI